MADDQLAGTGQGAEFWLSTDETAANLDEMSQVTSIAVPKTLRDFVETTHLKSTAKEYASTLPDTDEIKVGLNFRPGSDTDAALDGASVDPNPRYVRLILPIRGTLVQKYDFLAYVTYTPSGDVTVDGKMESEVGLRTTGAITRASYP